MLKKYLLPMVSVVRHMKNAVSILLYEFSDATPVWRNVGVTKR